MPVVPLGLAREAWVTTIVDGDLWVTNPGEQAFHEAVSLAELFECLHCSATQQAIVSCVLRNFDSTDALDKAVKEFRCCLFYKCFAVSGGSSRIDNIVTFLPLLNEFWD